MVEANASNAHIEYNTFVGLNTLMGIVSGVNHNINNNIIFGLNGRKEGAVWDTPAYIAKGVEYPDDANPANSILQTITSDNNCFISPYQDFLFVQRHVGSAIEFYTCEEAKPVFGYDINSKFIYESDPKAIFVDPDKADYNLIDNSICPKMGYTEAPADSQPNDNNSNSNGNGNGNGNNNTDSTNSTGSGIKGSGGCDLVYNHDGESFPTMLALTMFLLFSLVSINKIFIRIPKK